MASQHDEKGLLKTGRLLLRRLELHDLPLIEALFCNVEMMRYIGAAWTQQEAAETTFEWHTEWGKNNYYYGALELIPSNELIGIAGFTENTHATEAGIEFSWFVLPEHQGQGYASEITIAIMAYVFDTLHKERLFAETHPDNPASNRVLEKLNFTRLQETSRQDQNLPGFDRQVIWEITRTTWNLREH